MSLHPLNAANGPPYPAHGNADELTRLRARVERLEAALKMLLPLAEECLRSAPSHPDNAKLETARDALREALESK